MAKKNRVKKRWWVTVPISGAITFQMESESEPTLDEAIDHASEFDRSIPPDGEMTWEWQETLVPDGNVALHCDHASEFEVEEVKDV